MQKRKLLTSDQELTEKLREVLLAIFESFDADRDGALSTAEDTLEAPADEDPDADHDGAALRRTLADVLPALDERSREVIDARFGLSGEPAASLAQIGARLGVSRERVRQIERRALEQLREHPVAAALGAEFGWS